MGEMWYKVFILWVMSFYLAIGGVSADERKLEYSQHFTITDGLSHNGVTCVLEDSKGYLWIGTYDGLNRYDGYAFSVFKNTLDKYILVSNRVRTICEDENGNLWIGTDEGITIYNYSEEKFKNIELDVSIRKDVKGPIVRKFIIANEKGLVISTTEDDGILVFKKDYTFSRQFTPPEGFANSPVAFYDGIQLDKSNFLFVSSVGLVLFNIGNGQFQHVLENNIQSDKKNTILKISENTILATLRYGIALVEIEKVKDSFNFKLAKKDLTSYIINSSSVDKLGNLWLGTENDGILHIDQVNSLKDESSFKVSTFMAEPGILRVSNIFSSYSHGCWIGSFNDGLYRFDLKENPFNTYHVIPGNELAIRYNSLSHISVLDDHRALVIAYRGGLGLFNTQTQRFESVPINISKSATMAVVAVFVDSNKNIWLKYASDMGLYRVKAGSRIVEEVAHRKIPSLKFANIRKITEDQKGNIWIASSSNVYKIKLAESGEVISVEELIDHPFFKDKTLSLVRTIYIDPLYDYAWVGTDEDGLLRINLQGNRPLTSSEIRQFRKNRNDSHSISSNFVSSIIRLPNEDLWIGTEQGGICKVVNSETEPDFIVFSEKQGLSNNVVKNILYDDLDHLWIATNHGLNKFSTKDFQFRRYSMVDGLPFEDFGYAAQKLNSGELLFSGINGFCHFNPKNLPDLEMLPQFEFGELKIFNKTIRPGDTVSNRVLLTKRLEDQKEVVLKHNENVFSIELKSLHFSIPDNHFLKYQLLPVNEEWVEVPSSQRYINYNGLQPGEYVLKMMASNSLNDWTMPKEVKITIKPPFWKTTPAYIFYVFLITFIIAGIIYVISRIQSLNYNLRIEKIEKNNVKEVNEAKLLFFSNISHEIRTPITLISGPVNQMIERYTGNSEINDKLQFVQRQSKKILQLIDQVHDFQRSEVNLLKMNQSVFCFNSFIQELIYDFEYKATSDHKNLEIAGGDSKIYILADRDKMEKVFNNLLNNAFKYTKPNDSVKLQYMQENNELIVFVSDTGMGIDSSDLSHIFERFYQSHKSDRLYSGGSGIGLAFTKRLVDMHYGTIDAESEIDKGTKMTVRLPVIVEEPSDIELAKEHELLLAEEKYRTNRIVTENYHPEKITFDPEFSQVRIFFAEDNADMRTFVSEILSNFFQVTSFQNGRECFNALEDEWPDIVISDLLMPEMNGLELCKRIKLDIKTSHIPVILLTACTSIDDQVQGIKDGADAYTIKPFNAQYLVSKIESLLRNRKYLCERFKLELPLKLEKNKNGDHIFFEKLYLLIEKNLDNADLDVNSLAKDLYMSRTNLYQKIKSSTNQTPYEFLKGYRLKKAAEFLVQLDLSVNEVCIMTGFKSRSHFSKCFKEKYGISPGRYTAEMKKKYS